MIVKHCNIESIPDAQIAALREAYLEARQAADDRGSRLEAAEQQADSLRLALQTSHVDNLRQACLMMFYSTDVTNGILKRL